MHSQYNMRSPAVKRLMKEAQELREPTEQYHVQPLDDNLFEWHFTIRGPADSDFDGGMYHGRIILPPEYPMKPPSIILLTPNGRFEIFKKICLSISGHHPESWQPSWSIRTALLAIIGFMPTHGAGAIGSLDYSTEERKVLAKKSQDWKCPNCGCIGSILPPVTQASKKTTQEAKELATQINFQAEKPKDNAQSKNIPADNSDTSEMTKPPNEDTNSATSSTAIPNNFQPTQFPWNPFMATPSPGMIPPFGFPFPMSHANSGNTLVPRFPLPCYAPAPVYPPGMNIQNIGPWLPQQPNIHPSTQTLPNIAASLNTSASLSSPAPTITSSNITSTAATSDVTTPVSTNSSPSTNVTTSTTTPTSPTESPSVTSTPSTTTNATTDGLRQRQTNAPAPTETVQNAEMPRQQQSNGDFSLVLIVILVCAIGLLIFRKLYSAFRWSLVYEYI